METDLRVESGSMIRVAVLAVGEMPAAQLRDYVSMLVQHTRISLASVSPYYTEHQKSPFALQPWESGSLLLKFLVGGGGGAAATMSPWEDFQAQRKILGVIGLCHCPVAPPDISHAYEQFLSMCRAYPNAQVTRFFAFHPTHAHMRQEDEDEDADEKQQQQQKNKNKKKKKEFLVMFPSSDRQNLELHMQTLMQDFAACLLMAFESWVLHLKPAGLTTPLDSQTSSSSSSSSSLNSDELNKKRKLGRVQKTIGDYCLLAGSPSDANAHYSTAIELARLSADFLWHAGAIEGHVCALVAECRSGMMIKDDDALLPEQEVQFLYMEAIQLYRRVTALSFELESTLKLARFLCRKELAREVADLVVGAVEGSKALMDVNDRLVVNVEAAGIFGALGYERKAAFYGRQVALLYKQQNSHWAAVSSLQVMSFCSHYYRCETKSRNSSLVHVDGNNKHQEKQGGEWSTLQMDVLMDMLVAAVRAGDAMAAWSAAGQLLRHHYPLITPNSQFALANALSMAANRLPWGTRSPYPVLPFVRLHSYVPMPAEREIVKRTTDKEWWMGPASSGPFIYTPFVAKGDVDEKLPVIWVVGEPVEVLVELANPCAFEVFVESISLSVGGHGCFDAFTVSVTLPPSAGQLLSLSGMPLSVGTLTIRGCIVKCFGMIAEHLFEDVVKGAGAPLVDPFKSWHLRAHHAALSNEVEVVQPLPLLVARVLGGEGAAVLYEGEIREVQISLSNASVVPVVEAHLALTGKQQQSVISIGHGILEDALPLFPGATVLVPVVLKAGSPTPELDVRVNTVKPSNDLASPMLVIHYAGPLSQEGKEVSPGRRLALPLQLHVHRGLCLVQARLLSMEVAANISSAIVEPPVCGKDAENGETLVKMDPYRGSWGLRLLELELWNTTDVLFEITVSRKDGGSESEKLADDIGECLYPRTRIERDYSACVLIQLERFNLAGLDKASLAQASVRKDALSKQYAMSKDMADRGAKAELNSAIEELSSRICVKWHSGRNSAGVLPIKDALREALQASALKILLPDPLTFGFRLVKTSATSPESCPDLRRSGLSKVEAAEEEEEEDGAVAKSKGGGGGIAVRELALIEMLVRNNTSEAMKMTLTVACRDVAGTSCLGAIGSKTTVLWAGTLDGMEVEVGAVGEVVHRFALIFLVPGQYTLLGGAIIQSKTSHDPLCYNGPPFAVLVAGAS